MDASSDLHHQVRREVRARKPVPQRQQQLATMLLMGINRIIVT